MVTTFVIKREDERPLEQGCVIPFILQAEKISERAEKQKKNVVAVSL